MMKKYSLLKNIVLSTAIINSLCLTTAFAGVNGITNGDNINVRTQNSIDSNVIGKLSNNTKVSIKSVSNDWFEIDYNGEQAFISTQYVKITETLGIVNGSDINVRQMPSTDSEIIGKLNLDDKVTVKGTHNEFLLIDYKGSDAYVHTDFVNAEMLDLMDSLTEFEESSENDSLYVVVTATNGLNFRSQPSTESQILDVFLYRSAYDVLEVGDEWIKVQDDNGTVGYLNAKFVSVERGVKPENNSLDIGEEVINYAKQFLGTPYVWAGNNLRTGVDCSGFVYSVMKNFGITVNRTSRGMVGNGAKIDKANLKAGDLVFFDTNGTNRGQISHVGIYMGNGQFIHSSSSRRTWGVTISSLNESYYIRTYVTACRVL